METYLKTFMRNLLEHKNDLNKYIDSLYSDKSNEDDLNGMFGLLKKEGLIKCVYADNRAYDVQLTTAGRHLKTSDLKLSDKEELLLLIDAIDDIERYFHRLPGEFSVFEVITHRAMVYARHNKIRASEASALCAL